jgi:hypothetical protein
MYNMKKQVLPILLALILAISLSTSAVFADTAGDGSVPKITKFELAGVTGVIEGDEITVTLPFGTPVDALVPTISFEGGEITVQVEDNEEYTAGTVYDGDKFKAQDFGVEDFPVIYTITGANGSPATYTIIIEFGPASVTKNIVSFTLNGAAAVITNDGSYVNEDDVTVEKGLITVEVPYDTADSLAPTNFVYTGKSIDDGSEDGTATVLTKAQNFFPANPEDRIVYTVTAQDDSIKEYTVVATKAKAKSVATIDKFVLKNSENKKFEGTIDQAGLKITVNVPYSQVLNQLSVDTTKYTGKGLTNNGKDFDNVGSAVYTVTAEDDTAHGYSIFVINAAPKTGNLIESFVLQDSKKNVISTDTVITEGTIDAISGVKGTGTITLVAPYDYALNSVTPVVKISDGATIDKTGAENFAGGTAVVYQVTAEDTGLSANINPNKYSVTIKNAVAKTDKQITKFTVAGVDATIDGLTITAQVPYGTGLTALVPDIEFIGKKTANGELVDTGISPKLGVAADFSNGPVDYVVYAENGSATTYKVTVTAAPVGTTKEITTFAIGNIAGTVADGTVAIEVPYGTDVKALAPTIAHNGASISPASGVAQDFSSPVTYTVTAQDNSTKAYVVTVTVAKQPTPPATKVGWDHSTGVWKYFKADGSAQTGWFYDSSYKAWFYFTSAGNMVAGKWLHDTDGSWYYLSGNGKMVTGKQTIGGKAYSFKGNGVWIA